MISKILAALGTIKEIISLFKSAWALYKKAQTENWIKDGKAITKKITDAETPKERRAIVKKLNKLLGKM